MPDLLVLVNGLPGSGKSTLAYRLGMHLGAVVISKDVIKEAVATALNLPLSVSSELGPAAMEMAWSVAAEVADQVIVESWWFRPRDREFARAGINRVAARRVLEIWCDVPTDVARQRYEHRRRHPLHHDRDRLTGDWETWAEQGEPLSLSQVLTVDTSRSVDPVEVAARVGTLAA